MKLTIKNIAYETILLVLFSLLFTKNILVGFLFGLKLLKFREIIILLLFISGIGIPLMIFSLFILRILNRRDFSWYKKISHTQIIHDIQVRLNSSNTMQCITNLSIIISSSIMICIHNNNLKIYMYAWLSGFISTILLELLFMVFPAISNKIDNINYVKQNIITNTAVSFGYVIVLFLSISILTLGLLLSYNITKENTGVDGFILVLWGGYIGGKYYSYMNNILNNEFH